MPLLCTARILRIQNGFAGDLLASGQREHVDFAQARVCQLELDT